MLAFALGLLPAAYLIWRPAHARWLHEKALDVVELVRLGRGGQ